jgi:hypothetical protein
MESGAFSDRDGRLGVADGVDGGASLSFNPEPKVPSVVSPRIDERVGCLDQRQGPDLEPTQPEKMLEGPMVPGLHDPDGPPRYGQPQGNPFLPTPPVEISSRPIEKAPMSADRDPVIGFDRCRGRAPGEQGRPEPAVARPDTDLASPGPATVIDAPAEDEGGLDEQIPLEEVYEELSMDDPPEDLESKGDPVATSQDRPAQTPEPDTPHPPDHGRDSLEAGAPPDPPHQRHLVDLEDLPSESVESLGVDILAAVADANVFPGAGRLVKVAHQLLIEPHIRGELVTFDVGRLGFKVHATATDDHVGVELGVDWHRTETGTAAQDAQVPPDARVPSARVDWLDAHWEIDHTMPCAVAIAPRATLSEVPQPYIDADAVTAFLEREAKQDKPFAFIWLDPLLKLGLVGWNPVEGDARCSTFAQVSRDGKTLRLYTALRAP